MSSRRNSITLPMNDFIISGNEIEVQRLLKNGANPNATDENGNSALILAAEKGNQFIIISIY